MRSGGLTVVFALLILAAPTLARAQPWAGHDRRDDMRWRAPAHDWGEIDRRPPAPWREPRRNFAPDGYDDRQAPIYRPPVYSAPRYGAPALRRWREGDFLPPPYRGYPLGDYARYHLRRPPRGYYWCRNGDQFLLVAVASGLIFEVISGGD